MYESISSWRPRLSWAGADSNDDDDAQRTGGRSKPVVARGESESAFARLVREDTEQSGVMRMISVEDVVRVAIQNAPTPESGQRDVSDKLRTNVMKVDRAWLRFLDECGLESNFASQVGRAVCAVCVMWLPSARA